MKLLYNKFAKYYDLFYVGKKYGEENAFIERMVKRYGITGKEILEVGCGTGNHAVLLKKKGFSIVGIDLSKQMIAIAKKKVRGAKFVQGDMRNFNLNRKYDIILCLFSTMHYNNDYSDLEKTIGNFYSHLKNGGLLVFDMGFNKERFEEGHLDIKVAETKNLTLVRIGKSSKAGKDKGKILFAYVLVKNGKAKFFSEDHKMGIFDTRKVKQMMQKAGFETRIYENYSDKLWNRRSNQYVVFTGIKK